MRRSSISRVTAALALAFVAVTTAGCAPTPEPVESATPTASTSTSASPSSTPTSEPLALPDCLSIYSPALVASLTAEGREPLPDLDAGLGGTLDPAVRLVLDGLAESVSCGWILPASESGSTTTIAVIDASARAALEAAFAASGFTASTALGGTLYSLDVDEEFLTYRESHLLVDDFWIGSFFTFGDAESLTLDAAAQLSL